MICAACIRWCTSFKENTCKMYVCLLTAYPLASRCPYWTPIYAKIRRQLNITYKLNKVNRFPLQVTLQSMVYWPTNTHIKYTSPTLALSYIWKTVNISAIRNLKPRATCYTTVVIANRRTAETCITMQIEKVVRDYHGWPGDVDICR